MNAPKLRIRVAASLQLGLLVPALIGGSVCIPADGSERPEFGICVCTVPFLSVDDTAVGVAGIADCGPCRDEEFSALRSQRPAPPSAPPPASTLTFLGVLDVPTRIVGTAGGRTGEPPDRRLVVLRC